jgi:hypothetical protein
MSPAWVNGRFLEEGPNKKIEKWKPAPEPEKILWGACQCGQDIYEGESVGMHGEHKRVVCHACWMTGNFEGYHLDCAGLILPGVALEG